MKELFELFQMRYGRKKSVWRKYEFFGFENCIILGKIDEIGVKILDNPKVHFLM